MLLRAWSVLVVGVAAAFCVVDSRGAPPAREVPSDFERWERALDTQTTFTHSAPTLHDVAAHVRRLTGENVFLDERALQSAGIDPKQSLHGGEFRNVSLEWVLKRVLGRQIRLVPRDGAFLITCAEEQDSHLFSVVYEVGDLLEDNASDDGTAVCELVGRVQPPSWFEAGGPCSCDATHGRLVVNASAELHRATRQLLAAAREALRPDRDPTRVSWSPGREPSPAVLRALEHREDYDFRDKPLQEVVTTLRKRWRCPIVFDRDALKQAGISLDEPVTFAARRLRGADALSHICRRLGLEWLHREGLLLTTPEEADQQLSIRLYPVGDLVASGIEPLDGHRTAPDFQPLIDMIVTHVRPQSWPDGNGDQPEVFGRELLIVRQTDEVHREIERLLTSLRRPRQAKAKQPSREAPELHLVVYCFFPPYTPPNGPGFGGFFSVASDEPTPDAAAPAPPSAPAPTRPTAPATLAPSGPALSAADVAPLIRELIEPESWKGPDVFLRELPGRLAIRQTAAAHRRIRALLYRLGASHHTLTGDSFRLP